VATDNENARVLRGHARCRWGLPEHIADGLEQLGRGEELFRCLDGPRISDIVLQNFDHSTGTWRVVRLSTACRRQIEEDHSRSSPRLLRSGRCPKEGRDRTTPVFAPAPQQAVHLGIADMNA
jgi:hypothetical protein